MVLKTSVPKGILRWLNFAAWVAAVKPEPVDIWSTTLAHMPTYLGRPRNTVSAWGPLRTRRQDSFGCARHLFGEETVKEKWRNQEGPQTVVPAWSLVKVRGRRLGRWGEGGRRNSEVEESSESHLKWLQAKATPQRKTIPARPGSGVSTILNYGWGIAKGNGLGTENSNELQRAACSSWSSTPQNQRTERHSPDPQFWSWTCSKYLRIKTMFGKDNLLQLSLYSLFHRIPLASFNNIRKCLSTSRRTRASVPRTMLKASLAVPACKPRARGWRREDL